MQRPGQSLSEYGHVDMAHRHNDRLHRRRRRHPSPPRRRPGTLPEGIDVGDQPERTVEEIPEHGLR